MAKPTFNKLGLKTKINTNSFEWEGQTIEVVDYVPIGKKLEIVADIINDSIDDVLDSSIKNGSSASSQYTQLKSFYGKIKTIEDEISKRALVEARKNAKGLSSTILDSLS